MQLSVWQNRSLVFKILRFKKKINLPAICKRKFSAFSNRNFLKIPFLNNSFFAIWFKIALIIYEIAIPNTLLIYCHVTDILI
jgi:hypothetical protein